MNLSPFPVALAVTIFVCINVCFVIAASLGQIPWCFPYLEGCVSISKAAREIPSQQIYRICIMAGACMMLLYWYLCGNWLKQLKDDEPRLQLFVLIGLISALLLVANVALFGDSEGDLKRLRRLCVAGFFILHMGAQLLFSKRLSKFVKQAPSLGLERVARAKAYICSAQLAFAALGLTAPFFEARRSINNVVEWDFLLLMLCFYVATALAWKQTGYSFSSFTAVPERQ